MFLEGILSISGQPGLFKLVSKGKNSVIVESLTTGKRMPAFSTSRISTLEDVAIYTYDEDVPLRMVFVNMFEKYEGKSVELTKASNKDYFDVLENVLPDFDKERVYVSDAKKLVNWYNALIENSILIAENIKQDSESDVTEEIPSEEKSE